MKISYFDPIFSKILSKVFTRLFCDRCYDRSFTARFCKSNISHQRVDHILHIFYGDFRVYKSRRADDLFSDDATYFIFIFSRSCRYKYGLSTFLLELMKAEWSIFECRGKSESIVYEIFFSCSVSCIHPPDLGYRHMRFIDEHEIVFREEIEECRRSIAYLTIREIHRIILYSIHKSNFSKHFHIVFYAHLYSFRFDEFSSIFKILYL